MPRQTHDLDWLHPPEANEINLFLGYPARLGIDQQGKVLSFHKGDPQKKIPTSKLLPMTIDATSSSDVTQE